MAKKQTDIPQILGPLFSLGVPPAKKGSDYLNAYTNWVYAAISMIAKEVSMIEIKLYRKLTRRGELHVEEVDDHEAMSLLYAVNDFTTKQQLFEITQTYLELTGECPWVYLRDQNNKPSQIWVVRPDWINVIPSKTEFIKHYVYRPGGALSPDGTFTDEVIIDRDDLTFFKETNPVNPYRGRGRVESGAMTIDIDTFSDEWNRTFFYNNAMPSIFFSTDQKLKKEEVERFMQMWRSRFEGRKNSHKVAFLGGGLKPEVVSTNPKDLDFLNSKKVLRDQILAMFGMSKANLGIVEDVNRANQEATDRRFMKKVIKPRMVTLISHLNEFYLRNWGDEDLFFDFQDPVPEDVELNLKMYENGLRNGWLTINEVREKENLPRATGGDSIYLPIMMQPVGETEGKGLLDRFRKKEPVLKLSVRKPAKHKRIINNLTLPVPPKTLRQLRKDTLKSEIKHDLVKMLGNLMATKDEGDRKKEFKEGFWKNMIAKTDVEETSMKKILFELWEDQQAEVERLVDKRKKSIDTKGAADYLFSLAKSNKIFMAKLAPFIKRITQDKGREIFDFLGMPRELDTTTDAAVRFLEKDGVEFVSQINETTRKKLKKQLIEGLDRGEGIPELKRRIQDVFEEATSSRAIKIARTEVLRATNWATTEAYKQSNVVKGKEWLTSLDERVCEICEPMDGKIAPLNKAFDTSVGGVQEPPAHVMCRCTTIPVIAERRVPGYLQSLKAEAEKEKEKAEKLIIKRKRIEKEIEKSKVELKETKEIKKVVEKQAKQQAKEKAEEIIEDVKKKVDKEKKGILDEVKSLRDNLRKRFYGE